MIELPDPKIFNNPERTTLRETDAGALGKALLTLTKEFWVLKDRMNVMEVILTRNGINATQGIETFQPDEMMEARLRRESADMIGRVLAVLYEG